ncbi:MAG: hypothetical protein EOM67_08045 [Spirochaetia bacterium]|nr:hypothetical protein [Spirochaetia bacterium]
MTGVLTDHSQPSTERELISNRNEADKIYPIELPGDYRVICDTVEEIPLPNGDLSKTGLSINLYHWTLERGGEIIHRFTTDGKSRYDLWEALYDCQSLKEGNVPSDYVLRCLNPTGKDIPPWEREFMTRKLLIDEEKVLNSLNDEGNAIRFEKECEGYLIYAGDREMWYAWEKNHWELAEEKIGKAVRFIGKSINEEVKYWENKSNNDEENAKIRGVFSNIRAHASMSMNYSKQTSMRKMIEGSTMRIDLEKNTDPILLTYQNGAIDCKTGKIYEMWECEELKERYPTIYVDRKYTPDKRSKIFTEHLKAIFTDNITPDLSEEERTLRMINTGRFFLRLLGYLLYPGNPEQVFIFLWGTGSNGKSTTVDVLREVLGEQLTEASIKEIYVSGEDRPTSGIYNALPKRVLLFSEASDDENTHNGGRISQDTIKALTGDAVTSRFREMYSKSKKQTIICTPIGVTNELPRFDKDPDEALLRRLLTIPFPHKFNEEDKNKNFKDDLLQEKDEIFSMIIDELRAYLKEGLRPLPEYCKTTQNELLAGFEYTSFITTYLERTNGEKPDQRLTRNQLEELYIGWCAKNDIPVGLTIIQTPGYSESGTVSNTKQTLTRAEKNRLFNAMRVHGFNEKKIMGTRFFSCRIKNMSNIFRGT